MEELSESIDLLKRERKYRMCIENFKFDKIEEIVKWKEKLSGELLVGWNTNFEEKKNLVFNFVCER